MTNNVRINELELTRYGHFTHRALNFPAPTGKSPDIHIIHGPNEAGKSTISNAIVDFLFGMQTRSRYAFLHSQNVLEVSACLQTPTSNNALKRINKKLLDDAGKLLDSQFIDTHNLSREDYIARFWLDNSALLQGGESILNNKGELGAALFAATTGLNTLSTQIQGLLKTTDEFYKPGKRTNIKVKTLTDTLKSVRREIKELDTNKSAWAKLKKAQSMAMEKLENDRKTLQDIQTKQKRQEAVKSALIAFKTWETNLETLTTGDATIPSNWIIDFPKYREQHQQLTSNISLFSKDIDQSNTHVKNPLINEQWINYKDELDLIRQSTQAYRQDLIELSETQHKLDALTAEIDRRHLTLSDFPISSWSPKNAISAETLDQLDPLIENWKSSDATLRQLTSNQEEIASKLQAMTAMTGTTENTSSNENNFSFDTPSHLERLQSALEHGPNKELLQELKSQTDRLKDLEQLAIRLKANLTSAGLNDSTDLHKLKVPSIEIIDQCIEKRKELNTEINNLHEQTKNEKSKIDTAEQRLENLGHSKKDSIDDLEQSRKDLLSAWASHKTQVGDHATYSELHKSAQLIDQLLDQYDSSVTTHLKNAENSGQIIEILQTQKESNIKLATAIEAIKSTQDQLQTLTNDHEKLLSDLPNLTFEDPTTLRNWVNDFSAWQDADRDRNAQQDRVTRCATECAQHAEDAQR